VRCYQHCVEVLRDITDGLTPELADGYIAQPERLRVFSELRALKSRA
jgi:hypothetical protein